MNAHKKDLSLNVVSLEKSRIEFDSLTYGVPSLFKSSQF